MDFRGPMGKDDPIDFVVGLNVGTGRPLPGSKVYPCSKCHQPVFIAGSGQELIARRNVKPLCMSCLDWDDPETIVRTPTREAMLKDIAGVTGTNEN